MLVGEMETPVEANDIAQNGGRKHRQRDEGGRGAPELLPDANKDSVLFPSCLHPSSQINDKTQRKSR